MSSIHQASRRRQPLVYACSGCSGAAQTANHLAVRLDRQGLAEMSCIAGIGGDVPALLRIARTGRPMLVIDGCPLHCARHCLSRHGLQPDRHLDLSELGVRKRPHDDPLDNDLDRLWDEQIVPAIAALSKDTREMPAHSPPNASSALSR